MWVTMLAVDRARLISQSSGNRTLETPEYDRMDNAEDHLWWYRALHAYLLDAFATSNALPGTPVLDAGCGSGGLLRTLGAAEPQRRRVGLERLEQAAARARIKSRSEVVVGTVNTLPFKDSSFGAIFSADVLYHRDVDPQLAARESLRCLMPGGVLLVNVPAFQWLSSYHDQRVHGARRFSRQQLKGLLIDAGFTRIALHYWNSLLFPIMVARRLRPSANHTANDTASDVGQLPNALNTALASIVALERKLIQWGLRFPAGGSLLAIAYKP